MVTEPWDRTRHAPTLQEWGRLMESSVDLAAYPPVGAVAMDGTTPVGVGFLYTTPSAVAYLDGFTVDPRAAVFAKRLAFQVIVSALVREAEERGHSIQVAITDLPGVFVGPAVFTGSVCLGSNFSYFVRRA